MPGTQDIHQGQPTAVDYSTVANTARVAVYDDKLMPPRIIEIPPGPTNEFIEALAACINEQKTLLGGEIPYTAIREVTENFIHAQFKEIVVSILDKGNTIRFCDQGPGITDVEKAQLPGFTSATEPMKAYIRGVGSGLPMVKEYLDLTHGRLYIEDNIEQGAAVTISLAPHKQTPTVDIQTSVPLPLRSLTDKEREVLGLFEKDNTLGVTDIVNITGGAASSVHKILEHLEEFGFIEKTRSRKRCLTAMGKQALEELSAW